MTNEMMLQVLAAFLFTTGLLVVLLRRDTIMILMGIELLLNAANLSLVAFSKSSHMIDDPDERERELVMLRLSTLRRASPMLLKPRVTPLELALASRNIQ